MTTISGSWIATVLLVLLACLVIALLWVMIWDGNRFVVKEYAFSSKKLKKACRFVFLSDLHNKEYGAGNERLLEAIEALQPDFVLVGGDMMTASPGASFQKSARFLRACAAKYPVYYALGNHEYRARLYPDLYGSMYDDYMDSLKGCGITILDNESCVLYEYGVRLTGLSIEKKYYKRLAKRKFEEGYLQKTIGRADDFSFQILLAHDPEFFPDYALWKPELVLAGHMHGGVARIPGIGGVIAPSLLPFPHYDGGFYEERGSKMIISRGLGMHTLPVRLFNPGELIAVALRPE